jgi:hypothetical protein
VLPSRFIAGIAGRRLERGATAPFLSAAAKAWMNAFNE